MNDLVQPDNGPTDAMFTKKAALEWLNALCCTSGLCKALAKLTRWLTLFNHVNNLSRKALELSFDHSKRLFRWQTKSATNLMVRITADVSILLTAIILNFLFLFFEGWGGSIYQDTTLCISDLLLLSSL